MQYQKWLIPVGLFVLALILVGAGGAWSVITGVGIPDQDPTPAMLDYARFHMGIIEGLWMAGTVAFLAALASAAVLPVAALLRQRRHT